MAIHKLYSLIDPLQVQYFQGARVLILQSINVKKNIYMKYLANLCHALISGNGFWHPKMIQDSRGLHGTCLFGPTWEEKKQTGHFSCEC